MHAHPMKMKMKASSREKSLLPAILAFSSILLLYVFWSSKKHVSTCSAATVHSGNGCCTINLQYNHTHDPPNQTFYDDPELSYAVDGKPIENWDQKRKIWLKNHPSFAADVENRIFILSGTQPTPCKNPIGDYLLMRTFKNKVDYSRINGYQFFYNDAVLQPKMDFCWAKIPMIRALMLAHPETEWVWWIDSDAIFTDMDSKFALEKYKDHNFIMVGFKEKIYKEKTWLSVNAGVFLIRNCQWSLDLLDTWASIGPISPDVEKWGKILSQTLTERTFEYPDDQSALVYLMVTQKEKWGDKIYIESDFWMDSYWLFEIDKLENYTKRYQEIERKVSVLRRRHAEVVTESYGEIWKPYLINAAAEGWRRPLITHFAGCQPCSGSHNPDYKAETCWGGMERVLNFADNQVLRNFGFVHSDLNNTNVVPLPFDFLTDDSDPHVLV